MSFDERPSYLATDETIASLHCALCAGTHQIIRASGFDGVFKEIRRSMDPAMHYPWAICSPIYIRPQCWTHLTGSALPWSSIAHETHLFDSVSAQRVMPSCFSPGERGMRGASLQAYNRISSPALWQLPPVSSEL